MNDQLINEFLSEDGDAFVRQMLLDSILEMEASGGKMVKKYTFNRFSVSIDTVAKRALIEDDLMVGEEGECNLNLDEFIKIIRQSVRSG